VKYGTTRQQQEEGGRDITYMSNEPDIEPPAKESPPSDGVGCTHSQCDLTQLSTKETLPSTISQIQDGERTQPQELVESGREDMRKDSDEMETEDEVEEMTPDIRCGETPTHQHRETIKKTGICSQHPTCLHIPNDEGPPVKDITHHFHHPN